MELKPVDNILLELEKKSTDLNMHQFRISGKLSPPLYLYTRPIPIKHHKVVGSATATYFFMYYSHMQSYIGTNY